MQFLASRCVSEGHRVEFLSVALSAVSVLKRDARIMDAIHEQLRRGDDGVVNHLAFSLWHPQNLRTFLLAGAKPSRYYRKYGNLFDATLQRLPDFDAVIIESGYSVALTRSLRQRFPTSKLVYWVSDDPISLELDQCIIDDDREACGLVDAIVVAAPQLIGRYPGSIYIKKGIDLGMFSIVRPNPYSHPRNVLSIGSMLFDYRAVYQAAKRLPEYLFHIFGPPKTLLRPRPSNILHYGFVPFDQLVPFIQHCQVGLVPYRNAKNIEYISRSSLKIAQYSFCSRPIVAPKFACSDVTGFYPYIAGDGISMASMIQEAISGPGAEVDYNYCCDWAEVFRNVEELIGLKDSQGQQ
jgi:2-beta-glucuronyltransferase